MVRIFRHYVSPVKLSLAITDFAVILGATFAAEWLRHSWLGIELNPNFQITLAKFLVPLFFTPILLGLGGYQSDAVRDVKVFSLRLIIALFATAVVLSAFLYFFPVLPLWRSILVLAMVISSVLMYLVHVSYLRFAGSNFLSRRVVLFGDGPEAEDLIEYAEKAAEAGLNIVSVVTAATNGRVREAETAKEITAFDDYLAENRVEMVILANQDMGDLPIDALISAKLAGVEIKDRLTFFEQVRGYVALPSVKPEWIIFSDGFKGGVGIERTAKRLLDILISLVALVASLPLIVLAAAVVAVSSRGPVLYRQERVGLNNKAFNLLKFRSMVVDAENKDKPQWAKESDPRVTLVGRFLRRTRIDELPQIVNVLKGDMSFVGPRPERPFFVNKLEAEIPFFRERHCVKPGITGWAQIQYPYGASVEDSRRKLEYDLYYIKNYSIFLDILIILQTVRVILFPIGVR
jgi:sugar transferase (PEP-CTERM system associated)